MPKGKRWLISYPVIFVAALIAMILLLVFSALIPRELIQANMEESADYIGGVQQDEYALPGVYGTQIHYTADAIWLSIAYGLDSAHPLESAMRSSYYLSKMENVCRSFAAQVENQLPGNTQYLRYWHGAAADADRKGFSSIQQQIETLEKSLEDQPGKLCEVANIMQLAEQNNIEASAELSKDDFV